jgi:predicted DNA-binding antitoxin AbrB/MazE fold protein
MTTKVEAIYDDGKLLLLAPLPLPDKARVRVTIEIETTGSDRERAARPQFPESALMKIWDNPDDEVFNELLAK